MDHQNDQNPEGRQPRNLEDLLRLSIQNVDESNPSTGEMPPMTDDRRNFLEAAMSGLTGPSPTDHMKVLLQRVHTLLDDPHNCQDNDLMDEVYEHLEEIGDWCENIDLACDFQKIGGFSLLPKLDGADSELCWRCGDLVAKLCQNNIYCQRLILGETDMLDRLVAMCSDDQPAIVRVKALYGLSGLLRGFAEAQQEFVKGDGFGLILKSMQDEEPKLSTKASFLLMAMMRENAVFKKELTQMGYVEQLLTLLNRQHSASHENFMAALLELLSDNSDAVKEASRADLQIVSFLNERINLLSGKEEYQEERDHAVELRKLLLDTEDQMER